MGRLIFPPGTMKGSVDEAREWMQRDGTTEMPFYTSGNLRVRRGVHFLYGRKYREDSTQAERIEAIQKMLDEDPTIRSRKEETFASGEYCGMP
jgi:hypothetical protein